MMPNEKDNSLNEIRLLSLVNHINVIAKKYAISNMEKLNAKGITLLVNYGDSQKVKHYHLHLLPNYGTRPEKDVKEVFEVLNG